MADIATTTAASQNVLLVTAGEYSYYGVETVLLIPEGRNAKADIAAFYAMVDQLCKEHGANVEGVEKLREELSLLDRQRKRLPKDTPQRAAAWQKCQAIKAEVNKLAAETGQANHAAISKLYQLYAPMETICDCDNPENWVYIGCASHDIDGPIMAAWLMQICGYSKVPWLDSQECDE